jgi:hypothetical protein
VADRTLEEIRDEWSRSVGGELETALWAAVELARRERDEARASHARDCAEVERLRAILADLRRRAGVSDV